MDEEYKMFTASTGANKWVEVHNLNGFIERPAELLRYIDQALVAGRQVFGEKFEVEIITFQRIQFKKSANNSTSLYYPPL